MHYFEIKGKGKYPFFPSNKVWQRLKDEKGIDVFKISEKEEENETHAKTLERDDIISFIGYQCLEAGCAIEDKEVPLTYDKYEKLLTLVHKMEISGLIMEEIQAAFQYVISKLPNLEEGKK